MINWESLTVGDIKKGIEFLQSEAEKARQIDIALADNFYYGGDRTKQYLQRHSVEEDHHWAVRQDRFAHWGYTGAIGETLRDGIAARPIIREITNGDERQNAYFTKIYTENWVPALQRDWYQGQVVHGDGFAKASMSADLGRIAQHAPHVENVWVERHPDDARRMRTYVEEVDHPTPKKRGEIAFWVWTAENYILIDGTSEPIRWEDGRGETHSGWIPNPYKRIPASHVRGKPMSNEFWGQSYLVDVIQLNRLVNNAASDLDRLFQFQAHSQPWVKGRMHTAETESGPTKMIGLEIDGDMGYASPSAKLLEGLERLKDLCSRMFDLSGVPDIAVRGGSATSGYELEVRFRRMDEVVRDMQVEAVPFEEDFGAVTCAVANAHFDEIKDPDKVKLPDDPEFNIEFKTQLFPKDEARAREQDRQDWQDNLMTTEDYLKRQRPDIPEGDRAAYAAELEEQRQRTSVFGATPEASTEGSLIL